VYATTLFNVQRLSARSTSWLMSIRPAAGSPPQRPAVASHSHLSPMVNRSAIVPTLGDQLQSSSRERLGRHLKVATLSTCSTSWEKPVDA
jgi:hypothetical protein